MNLRIVDGLPFFSMIITFRGRSMHLDHVLLDTGSAGTILRADRVSEIGMEPEPHDVTHVIRGIGGTEFVYVKTLDAVHLGECAIRSFPVEIGQMDYGYEMDGIIGFNLIHAAGMVIDARNLEVRL